MSTKTNKGSFLAKALPSIFGFLNEKDVDQAKLAEFEQEAKAALEAGGGEGLDNPEDLEEPDTEASEDDELTKLKAENARLLTANASLKKLENLSIPVPTRPPPVSIEGKYERIATLARYRVTYALLGGISRPKKMQVVDSNGVTYKEIVS